MPDRLFDTWDGDDATLAEDLSRVLHKHLIQIEGVSDDRLGTFLADTVQACAEAQGSGSEYTTTSFILFKGLGIRPTLRSRSGTKVQ